MRLSEGFTRFWPSVATIIMMALTYVFLALSIRSIPLGTAYAIWAGIGAVGAAAVGVTMFNEPATAARAICIGLIVLGIVGLKLASP
jgi:quaternary ammonium compound-resistance protein SugE